MRVGVVQNMRKCLLILYIVLLALLISITGCSKKTDADQTSVSTFPPVADKIQSLSKGISSDLWENGKYMNSIYTSRELFLQTKPNVKYEINPDMSLQVLQDDDQAALFATGFTAIKKYVTDEIDLTVPMDSVWRNTKDKYPEVLEQYFIHKYSFIRIYPYRNLAGQYRARQNLCLLEPFRIAYSKKANDAKVMWFPPQWDPVFKEWSVNGIFPIKDGNDLIGVMGCKVSLRKMLKACAGNDASVTGIFSRSGYLVMANPSFYQILGIPPIQNTNMAQDLHKLKNQSINTMLNNMIVSPYTNFIVRIGEDNYFVECRLIPEMNWVVFKMNKR